MRGLVVLAVLWLAAGAEARGRSRYGFYREMGSNGAKNTRRVFGGSAVELAQFPNACMLMDRYWGVRCSATVVAPRWALTAAHCVTPRLAYVKYNTRRPTSREGQVATIQYLYRHPNYKVVQADEGRGMDVTVLHHDVGLVRVLDDMVLPPAAGNVLRAMRRYNPVDMHNHDVEVLGFGRTEAGSIGEELFGVKLRMVFCERGAWYHCVCGVAVPEAGRSGGARGVCSGDSGGPVLYRGAQVGVTSMGPLECATMRTEPEAGATSVFTSLYNYVDLINATICSTEDALRMNLVPSQGVVSAAIVPGLAAAMALTCLSLGS